MKQSSKQRKQHVDKAGVLSVVRQCELLQIHRSGLYYKPCEQSPENLDLMRVIDEQYLKYPFYGVPRMTKHLQKLLGRAINKKRVERLYKLMGLEAIGPKPIHPNRLWTIRSIRICLRTCKLPVPTMYGLLTSLISR